MKKKALPTKDKRIQWHPAFVAAMSLELWQDRDNLMYEKEYNLNTKPLSIDLLVLRKNTDMPIENEIGRIFRGHNILEYKSADDHLDVDVFYKVSAYAALYKANGERLDSIRSEDVTVSLIRQTRPSGLFRYFRERGIPVSNPYPGIYYIEGEVLFLTQIVVVQELDKASHIWLGALSGKMGKQDMAELLGNARNLREKAEREYADSVLQVSVTANKRIVDELKEEEEDMCQALLEIMEPELKQSREDGVQEGERRGERKGIRIAIKTLRELGHEESVIRESIIKNYKLTPAAADRFMKE